MVRADESLTTVRLATWADRHAIAGLVEGMGGHDGATVAPGWEAALGASLGHPDHRLVVAERAGRLVGVAHITARPSLLHGQREAWLGLLAVSPDGRGEGIGTQLLEAVDRHAELLGCAAVVLESSDWRTDAHGFYRSAGFAEASPAQRFSRPVPSDCGDLVERFLAAAARAAVVVEGVVAADDGRDDGVGADGLPSKSVDRLAEAAAVRELLALDLPIVSEEAGAIGGRLPEGAQPWIALDPIDGTRNLGRRHPPWAIAIGLVADGRPLAGYVVDLSSGRRWWGVPGDGAWVDRHLAQPRPGGLLVVPGLTPEGQVFPLAPGFDRLRMAGATTVELCRVADGAAGAFVDLHRGVAHPHDLAGPLAVLLAAGCTVRCADGTDPVLVPDPAHRYHLVAAASAADATALLAAARG